MKHAFILPLFLLGTVSALHLKNDAPQMESLETMTDLSQDLEGSGKQEGELVISEEVISSEGEEVKASGYEDAFEDEEAMESDPAALDKDVQCPREEDTVKLLGSPGCKACNYLLVRTPRSFKNAQDVCRVCYHGNLVSIHSFNFNKQIQRSVKALNQGQVWIGGMLGGWLLWKRFCWIDGSHWNFEYWAAGQPKSGSGSCVTLCTRGGRWRRALCERHLPFICSN
ncbi:proteoglycan 3 [Choloepus didactylus]|uniref:proteoglycan 3 n=1 Tax=Choloepus didactylus TaxID=27675 RepID=UPI00189F831B|nr:proteoglycan 3 [Choloepus didactylus]